MRKYGELITPTTLRFERMLPGPIERAWEYLVDGEKRGKWFASGPLEKKDGGKVDFIFDHSKLSPDQNPVPKKYENVEPGMTITADVVKCAPPHILIIEWEGLVTFELESIGDKVKFTLTHEKLPIKKDPRVGTMAGWHTHLDLLVDHMEGKTPKSFWPVHMGFEEEYAKRFE